MCVFAWFLELQRQHRYYLREETLTLRYTVLDICKFSDVKQYLESTTNWEERSYSMIKKWIVQVSIIKL